MTPVQKKQYDSLSVEEKQIYDALLKAFPKSDPDSVYNHAINGGVKFHFIPK